MADQSRLSWALLVSLLLHILLASLMPFLRRANLEIPKPPAFLDVDVLPPPQAVPKAPPVAAPQPAPEKPQAAPQPALPVPKNQIVAMPEQGEEKAPENTRLLSDRDNTVKEETIKRGEPAAGDPDAKPKPPAPRVADAKPEAAPRKEAPAPHKVDAERAAPRDVPRALPKLDQLLPSTGDLIREGAMQPEEPAAKPAPEQHAAVQRDDLLRYGDPWKGGSLRGGSMDYLPDVREGDITMLNTKAEQFAPFVRRVAVRVFQGFWIALRRSVDHRLAQPVQEYAVVEAVMDKKGQLLSLTLKERSGSVSVATDLNLQNAVREGFFDRNPPSGAEAADGKIHFLFQAQVQLYVDPRMGPVGGAHMVAGLL